MLVLHLHVRQSFSEKSWNKFAFRQKQLAFYFHTMFFCAAWLQKHAAGGPFDKAFYNIAKNNNLNTFDMN